MLKMTHTLFIMKNDKIVPLINGTYALQSQSDYFNNLIEEGVEYERKHAKDAPFSEDDIVYITHIPTTSSRNSIPTKFINKPMRVLECYKIPCTDSDLWGIELEGCEFMLTSNCVSRTKPF